MRTCGDSKRSDQSANFLVFPPKAHGSLLREALESGLPTGERLRGETHGSVGSGERCTFGASVVIECPAVLPRLSARRRDDARRRVHERGENSILEFGHA